MDLYADNNIYMKVIMALNGIAPVLCWCALLCGAFMVARRNLFGYYLIGMAVLGLIAHWILS